MAVNPRRFLQDVWGERQGRGTLSQDAQRIGPALFAFVRRRQDLSQLARFPEAITPAGSIWVIWPKGTPGINENDIRNEALARGLVDVKVVRFSGELSALKLVIRLADRG